jgi:hypothetical protein
MHVQMTYEGDIDAWTISHQGTALCRASDVLRWRSLLAAEAAKLEGHRVFILVCLDGFSIRPEVLPLYGKYTSELTARHARAILRYGGSLPTTAAIRLAAMRTNFPSLIYPTRTAAVRALRAMRSDALPGDRPGDAIGKTTKNANLTRRVAAAGP